MIIFDRLPEKHTKIDRDLLPEAKRITFVEYLNEMSVIVPQHVTGYKIKKRKKQFLADKGYTEVVKQLNDLFKKQHTNFIVQSITSNSALKDENIEAAIGFPDLTITFKANSSFYEFLTKPEYFDYAVDSIDSMLGHELVHREQILRSKVPVTQYHTDDIKKYLAQPTEIMAYAAQISAELKIEGLSKDKAFQAIRRNKQVLIEHFNKSSYALYAILFNPTSNEWKRLNKYIYQYIELW